MNHSFVLSITLFIYPVATSVIRLDSPFIMVLVFESSLFYLIMAPKQKRSDAGHLDLPMRMCQEPTISEKVKFLNLGKGKTVC